MLILHIVPDLAAGGAELMMKRLIESHLSDRRYDHEVISLRTLGTLGEPIRALGVEVEALGLTTARRLPSALFGLVRRIRSKRPDIVHTWMYHADLIGGLAARIAGVRSVIWGVRATYLPHGRGTAPATTVIRTVCASLSSRVPQRIVYVAESAKIKHEQLGYYPNHSLVIPNGYALPEAPADEADRRAMRRKLGLPEEALIIGSAGRYNALKDYPTFMAAAARLARTRPEVHFALAGRGLDPENSDLRASIQAHGLTARVHLLGEQQGLTNFLAATDIFCLHSISEGFPNVVAEAMAMAVPCVVTDVGAAALIVAETGLVVPPERPDLLAEALDQMANEDDAERRHRGGRARQRIAANFSIDAVGARYKALYASVAEVQPDQDQDGADSGEKPASPFQR